MSHAESTHSDPRLRRAVIVVCLANLAYFGVEFAVARRIGSVSLIADSVDFLEDAAINFLIVVALSWSPKARARVGALLALVILAPALAFLWASYKKFLAPVPPEASLLSLTGVGALVVNLSCALILTHFRHHSGSLTRAAFLSARNDAFANLGIIAAGAVTFATHSLWPDLIVGFCIALLNADAAKEVWDSARQERAVS